MQNLLECTNVWFEKYRPVSVQDVILPEHLKEKILRYLEGNGSKLPHLGLFSKNPGTGKSSLAKAIINDLQAEAIWINASLDKGIDVLRSKIRSFAAAQSLRDMVKIVVMDEFDQFSSDGQKAFRGFIDEFGNNVRFIFTGNYVENIIEPLLDRMEIYNFGQFSVQDVGKPLVERLKFILDSEGVEYTKEDIIGVIKQDFPSVRKMLVSLSQCVVEEDGKKRIDFKVVAGQEKLDNILELIKNKDVQALTTAVYSLGISDHVYGYLGSNISKISPAASNTVNMIISIAKYQSMAGTVRDRNLNLLACCFELVKLM